MPDEEKVILVVDDDSANSFICRQYLQENFIILSAGSGKEAVRIIQSTHVDLILLDIEMPRMDGFATYDEIRKSVSGVQIPVIFVTGRGDKKTVLKCKSKGAEGFIIKPLKKDVLLEKVRLAFAHRKQTSSRKKILIIDDCVEYLKLMKLYLQNQYEVMAINSTRTAIEYLQSYDADVLLIDYYMPLYNGADIMRIIKNGNMAPHAKVILMSGSMDVKILKECQDIGLDAALSKSATKSEILAKIEEVLHAN